MEALEPNPAQSALCLDDLAAGMVLEGLGLRGFRVRTVRSLGLRV